MALDLVRLAQLRRALAAHEAVLDQARAAIKAAREAVRAARRVNDTAEVKEQRAALKAAVERRRRRLARRAATLEEIEALRRAAEAQLATPEARLDGHGAGLPVLLLPLRIETRFLPVDGPPAELVVRIYPDEVHIDDHDPALTPTEENDGREYWRGVWRAGPGSDGGAAWERLRDIHGAPRAGWIVRSTEPLNPAGRPNAPLDEGEQLQPKPRFPEPPTRPEGSAARHARGLAAGPFCGGRLRRRGAGGHCLGRACRRGAPGRTGRGSGRPGCRAAGARCGRRRARRPGARLADRPRHRGGCRDGDPHPPRRPDPRRTRAAGRGRRPRRRHGRDARRRPRATARGARAHERRGGRRPGRPTNDAAGPPPAPPPLLHPPELAPDTAGGRLATALGLAPDAARGRSGRRAG